MARTSRSEFLAAVREATRHAIPPRSHDTEPVPDEPGRMPEPGDLTGKFVERAEIAGASVHRVGSSQEIAPTIASILREAGLSSALFATAPLLDDASVATQLSNEFTVSQWTPNAPEGETRDAAFAMECGVTGVDYAVAETGSLVICAAPEQGRSVSLLGRLHVAVVDSSQIIPDLYDLAPRLESDFPDGMPSNVNVITGPSKTADIELNLVIGVHGPGQVHIILVGS